MLKPFLSCTALMILFSSLAVLTVACSEDQQTTTTGSQQQSVPNGNLAAIQPPAKKPDSLPANLKSQPLAPSEINPNTLESALDKATSGLTISQSAQSTDDWNLVASQFEDAIALMGQVRRDSPNFPFAQRKIVEYKRQIKLAQQKARPSSFPSPSPQPQRVVVFVPQAKPKIPSYSSISSPKQKPQLPPPQPVFPSSEISSQNHEVFTAPIKRRIGGTPIVEVTFNGRQRFEMIVDTGASGTVITQEIANALGVVPVGKAKANTVSSKAVEFSIGYLDSMEVGGVMVNKVPVAIAGAELETGLLGHDFFGNYDVTIKRNVVEFRPQTHSEINSPGIQLTVPTLSRGYRFVKFP
ncbi:TIGR02281 family clan AA aspartic protease [Anabaena sp. PCC 7108]|uniref:retropepsin-like aspartic protease family protein n=1 Tax=Anabaena sp. PCC 7108 TaxID=163908 RepID=UPI000476F28D|nr:retropepsin-like aspartic protease [Anabaena sp. PCC 7108]